MSIYRIKMNGRIYEMEIELLEEGNPKKLQKRQELPEQPKVTLDTVIQQTVAKPQLLTQTPPEPAKQKAKQKTVRQKGRKITKTVKDADVIRQLESENAQLKAQLEAAQKEIEQIREQIIITEMQARGFQAVYQEDGSIQFVRQDHRPASVEL